jgi:hypothetical protein
VRISKGRQHHPAPFATPALTRYAPIVGALARDARRSRYKELPDRRLLQSSGFCSSCLPLLTYRHVVMAQAKGDDAPKVQFDDINAITSGSSSGYNVKNAVSEKFTALDDVEVWQDIANQDRNHQKKQVGVGSLSPPAPCQAHAPAEIQRVVTRMACLPEYGCHLRRHRDQSPLRLLLDLYQPAVVR